MFKLDYNLKTPEERMQYAREVVSANPDLTNQQLEYLADYALAAIEKEERKQRKILTDNRMVTINRRETSFEGLAAQFENGEDAIYNFITEDKHVIFQPKKTITTQDLIRVPELRAIKEAIAFWENQSKAATGHNLYIIKQAIIDLRKDQYIVKDELLRPVKLNNITPSSHHREIEGGESIGADSQVVPFGLSLCDPAACSAILINYSGLKQECEEDFISDTWYIMQDFDRVAEIALKPYPILEDIATWKIDGVQNQEIRERLKNSYNVLYSNEYISNLWRKKIPKLIAEAAEDEFISWYYLTQERGKYKKCSRCGKIKIAIPRYFSKNSGSSDGLYSICKECRRKKAAPGKNV